MSGADPSAPGNDAAGLVVGLLLAGGRGSRFDSGGHHDKLLARIEGQAVAALAAQSLVLACDRSFAVLPPGKPELERELHAAGCETLITEATRLGMGHSIAFGVARILERCQPACIVVMLGDMPRVRAHTISRVIDALRRHPASIAAPVMAGRRGHPVVFSPAHFEALKALRGDRGAASLLHTHTPTLVEVDDPGIFLDIDTPADLAQGAADEGMDRRRDTPEQHRP